MEEKKCKINGCDETATEEDGYCYTHSGCEDDDN
jgi:hypothetical protein